MELRLREEDPKWEGHLLYQRKRLAEERRWERNSLKLALGYGALGMLALGALIYAPYAVALLLG